MLDDEKGVACFVGTKRNEKECGPGLQVQEEKAAEGESTKTSRMGAHERTRVERENIGLPWIPS